MIIYNTLSDLELVALLQDGDHHAYTEIYKRHHQLLIVFVYRKLGDEEVAKDIVQDLFTNLWIKKESIPAVNNLAGYLTAAAKNSMFNFFEHQNVKSKYIESFKHFASSLSVSDTDHLAREQEWKKHIENAVQSLPKKMKYVFELSRKEHLSNIEIAKKLNTSESNVSQHLSNAAKILRTKLGSFFSLF